MSHQFFTLSPDHQGHEHIIQHDERLDIREQSDNRRTLADGMAREVFEETTRLPQWAIDAVYIVLLARGLEGAVQSLDPELALPPWEGLTKFLKEVKAYFGSDE